MAIVVAEGSFADLRRLADYFSVSARRPTDAGTAQIARLVCRLGTVAIPFLGRELAGNDPRRRETARDALATLATTPARDRVIAMLSSITQSAADDVKVSALGLLAELGEHPATRFHDPSAIQRRSALALAAQLTTPADVASAVDLMIRQLGETEILLMIEILIDTAPHAAARLVDELGARLDLAASLRDRVAVLAARVIESDPAPTSSRARPTQVAVLVDAAARIVVVASRKVTGERRWRRWAVLVGASGRIEDCLHEDDAGADDDAAPLIANLCADGYRVASTELEHARSIVMAAVRHATRDGLALSSAYYLGRDLLELANEHLGHGRTRTPTSIGHAIELLASGDPVRAQALVDRCTAPRVAGSAASHPADVAATLAACLLARGQIAEAVEPLERAIAEEPTWPLHHWNLASALHALGDSTACYHALRRFVATSTATTGNLLAWSDPDQPARLAHADRLLGELERTARLAGAPIATRPARRRRRQTKKRRA